jgi:hypothetical protein
MKRTILRTILFALGPMLNRVAGTRPAFRTRLKQHDIVAQIGLKDGSIARHFIIAAGKGKKTEDGKLLPLDVKVGDQVLFGKYSGTEIKLDGKEYLMMREDELLAVIEK